MRVSSLQKKRRKRRSGKGYDGPRSELYSNSSRKMQAAALAGSFTIVCRAAAVGRWLSVRLSVPRSCCRSSQLPGGEITEPKFQKKKSVGLWWFYSLGDLISYWGKKFFRWLYIRLFCSQLLMPLFTAPWWGNK